MKLICSKIFDKVTLYSSNIPSFQKIYKVTRQSNVNYASSKKDSHVSVRWLSDNCSCYKPPWKILFFGSDAFAVKSLQALCSKFRTDTLINVLDVCTTSAQNWKKEHNPVYQFAEKENLTLLEWPLQDCDFINRYDVGVVVSFGYLIPENVIRAIPLGILNVHGSLLPRWRGAAPIMRAIMNGDTETGVTIMKISPHRFDIGDIVRQYGVRIDPHESAVTLDNRLADLGARLLMECIRDLPRSIQHCTPQSVENATYAKKITHSTALIDWNEKTAEDVYNLHRAISHLFPLTTYWLNHSVKFLNVKLDEIEEMNPENKKTIDRMKISERIFPGLVEFSPRRSILRIQCKDGKWICVDSLLVSEKKVKSPSDFHNGFLSKLENSLSRRFSDRPAL